MVINNIEHDHADIFHDLEAILQQFHGFLRITPSQALVLVPHQDEAVEKLLEKGCWTPTESVGEHGDWRAVVKKADGSLFEVQKSGIKSGQIEWGLIGEHNVQNALAAIAASHHAGVPIDVSCAALARFENVKRRLETVGVAGGITVYDDFAHHPTAIQTTLQGLRAKVGNQRIIAVLEPRSNSMRLGLHKETLGRSLSGADEVWILEPPDLPWDIGLVTTGAGNCRVQSDIDAIITEVATTARKNDHILIMSNGDFGGIHKKLLKRITDGD